METWERGGERRRLRSLLVLLGGSNVLKLCPLPLTGGKKREQRRSTNMALHFRSGGVRKKRGGGEETRLRKLFQAGNAEGEENGKPSDSAILEQLFRPIIRLSEALFVREQKTTKWRLDVLRGVEDTAGLLILRCSSAAALCR